MRALLRKSVLQRLAATLRIDWSEAPAPGQPAGQKDRTTTRRPSRARATGGSKSGRKQAAQAEARRAPRGRHKQKGRADAQKAVSAPTPPAPAPPAASEAKTTSELLAHVTVEPGQGLEDLALAMGVPVTELEAPIKRLLAEHKITEQQHEGETTYHPA